MNKILILLNLIPTFLIVLAAVPSVDAQNKGNDPRLNGCSNDAQSLDFASQQVRVPYDIRHNGKIVIRQGDMVSITVELRWSKRCQAKWVKAVVPADTKMYLKDQYGNKYVEYTAQVNGQNYTDMWKDNSLLSACIKHPNYLQELCTNFK